MALKIDSLEVEIKTQADSASASIGNLNKELGKIARKSPQLKDLAKAMEDVKDSASGLGGGTGGGSGRGGGSKGGKPKGGLLSMLAKSGGGFLKSIGRIALYRGIRSALKAVTTAIKEGTSNLYQYSKMMGGSFAANLDKVSTSLLYLKNGLAVGLAPVIEWLTPLIVSLADAFANLGNSISEISANSKGEKYFTRAKKTFKEYAEAANKAKSAVLGFDELNVIKSETDFADMFEEAEVNADAAEKKALSLSAILSGLAAIGVGGGVLKVLVDLSKVGVIEGLNASLISLAGALGIVAGAFTLFATNGAGLKTTLKDIMKGLDKAVANATDNLPILKGFAFDVVQALEFPFEQLSLFADMIYNLFHGNWAQLGADAVNMLLNTVNLLVSLLNGAMYMAAGVAQKVINVGVGAINTIVGALDENLSKIGINWFNDWRVPTVDFTSNWTVPQLNFSAEKGFQIEQTPLGSNAGKQTGDDLGFASGAIHGVLGELGLDENQYLYGPQMGSSEPIQIYLDGKQIYGAVRKAELVSGSRVARGILAE